ncbi:hypothetical protein CH63R_14098 [Colletotrichum higginsianum IMI 349063]|uniref:Uncharacterized protein n=1 Tax=Colletotrichum higginsianum (strain IMI 349063) TaxID=759273 RepID=A0A1B7XSX7_COLHI|nr:hypothetical protein CH63R_14098 [Colletotrichum higginsianum IMI 349063]OBR02872.1 hypothetical protein CH63R_14098 [Colletotrichum higginsianum IMI 349063]
MATKEAAARLSTQRRGGTEQSADTFDVTPPPQVLPPRRKGSPRSNSALKCAGNGPVGRKNGLAAAQRSAKQRNVSEIDGDGELPGMMDGTPL